MPVCVCMQSLVHFDLKTANLLLGHRDRRPICKVADFGLSKQVGCAGKWLGWAVLRYRGKLVLFSMVALAELISGCMHPGHVAGG